MYSAYTKIDPSEHVTADKQTLDSKVKNKIISEIKSEIRKNLRSGLWDADLPESWADEIKVTYDGPFINVSFGEKIKAHEEGVEPHPMNYLYGRVIPLGDEGSPVFRKCTAKSLAEGKWWHPGMAGKGFIQDAIDTAIKNVENVMGTMQDAEKDRMVNQ